jgi:hypothetical protein
MRLGTIVLCICGFLAVCASAEGGDSDASPSIRRIVIAASTLLDGRGGALHNTRIVIEGARIVAIDPKASPVDYDLRSLTVLPGWIDGVLPASLSKPV